MTSCLLSVMLLIIFIWFERKSFSQIQFFLIFCLGTLILYSFSQNTFVPFSLKFDKFFSFFVAVFYVSYKTFKCFIDKLCWTMRIKCCSIFRYKLYFGICMIFSQILIIRGFIILMEIGYIELRNQINKGTTSIHSSIGMALLSSLMYLANIYGESTKKKVYLSVHIILLAVLSTSKMYFVLAILYIVPWYVNSFKVNLNTILFVFIAGVGSFFWLHLTTGKVAGNSQNLIQNLFFTLQGYYLGGMAAFQILIDGNSIGGGWVRTGKWLGNVYTAFSRLFYEKSYALFAIRVVCIGFVYALLSQKNHMAKYVKIYSWLPLFMIFFAEMFGSAIAQWICFVIAGFLVNVIINNNRSKSILNVSTRYYEK